MKIDRALAAAVLLAASPALALDIQGTLTAPPHQETSGPSRDCYWEEWNGFLATRDPRFDFAREVTVVLTGAGAPAANEATVRLSGGSLLPATIVVRPGAIVRLENQDEIAHAIGAEGVSGFASEATAPRQTRTVRITATAATNYALRDARVPHVRGHVHVVPDLVAVATVNDQGRYVFTGVPAGTYTLKVYHLGREVTSRPLLAAQSVVTIDPISLAAEAAQ